MFLSGASVALAYGSRFFRGETTADILEDAFRQVVDENRQQGKTAPEIDPVNPIGSVRRHYVTYAPRTRSCHNRSNECSFIFWRVNFSCTAESKTDIPRPLDAGVASFQETQGEAWLAPSAKIGLIAAAFIRDSGASAASKYAVAAAAWL